MVFKKSFSLLVASKTIPFFVVMPIISDHRCSLLGCKKEDGFPYLTSSGSLQNDETERNIKVYILSSTK